MTQQLIVGLIVAAAAFYAVWRWMPAGWRRSAARKLAAGTHRAGWVDQERADALAASLAKTSGCGSCDSCGSCGPKAPAGAGTEKSAGADPLTATHHPSR
ncbi:hypothetical protein M2165_000711 [Variovorax sp. TBS-050B]|uniref:DUF6587 family protein n=1 Tax=Variovorax sp. TBS-050B TaxID=2940551 RepID=UPI0024736923|nr:DUF6587 family protein [Variovorax sp. TBS-050B]MDH6590822.1 hypothetical protein [Variovorax sp. TBS-050B]